MCDSDYSDDEEQSYDQQIKNLAKNEAIRIFTKINAACESIKKAYVNKDSKCIIMELLSINICYKLFQNMVVNIIEYVLKNEPIICDIYYTYYIYIANKEIKPYIHMSKECKIEAQLIRDKLNF